MGSNYAKYTDNNPIARYLNKGFLDSLFYLAQKTNPSKVLDAGCGEGFVIERLRRDLSADFIGLDIESEALKIATDKNPEVNFQEASVYQLPFADNSFDLVVLSEVLEHLDTPDIALAEIRRVTKQYTIISVPHEPIWRVGNMARLKYWRYFGNTPGHINHWTRRAFVGLISGYFDIVELKTPLPWSIALCKAKQAN